MHPYRSIFTRPLRPAKVIVAEKLDQHDVLHRMTQVNQEFSKKPKLARQDDTGVDPMLLDLVRLRFAQIRHRPLGVDKYRWALKARGENEERLNQLKIWEVSSCFSEQEKTVLRLAEAIFKGFTKSALREFIDETRHYFKKEELTSLLLAIMAINEGSSPVAHHGVTGEDRSSRSLENSSEQGVCPYWRKIANRLSKTVVIVPDNLMPET